MKIVKITHKSVIKSYKILTEKAKPNLAFIVLTFLASIICSFGFKMNNATVILGAMVISPLLYSVVILGVASFKKDWKTFFQGILTFGVGLAIAISTAAFFNLFFVTGYRSEIVERLSSDPWDYFFVALFCGVAGTFAFFWPGIFKVIAGIAISVALIPPVVLVGVGLAHLDSQLIVTSISIVLLNTIGIYIGSFLIYAGLHVLSKKHS